MTAVDVRIDGEWYYSLSDWQVVGDSTPLIAGDMTGGAGTMSFALPDAQASRFLHSRPCLLRDPLFGETSGNLRLSSGNRINTTITGYSKIALLNVNRTAEAYSGTLNGAILYYVGLAGITTGITVESSIASRAVRFIGWTGNVLDRIKDLCAAQQIELRLTGETFTFGQPGGRTVDTSAFADYTWQASEDALTQNIEVAWYNTNAPASQLLYPAGGWHVGVPVFQVDAGQVAEYEIDLKPDPDNTDSVGMSALTLVQPTCVSSVSRGYSGPDSVYTVSGKDGLPITPAQWKAGGGGMKVEIDEGGALLRVTITGPAESEYAPYSIAMSSGTSDNYSSLRIYGTGMRYKRTVMRWATGLSEDRASQEVTSIVENVFLNSADRAYQAAAGLLSKHSAATYKIQGTLSKPPLGFGQLEGAVFIDNGTAFRIRSVTYTPSGGSFTAEQWTTQAFDSQISEHATGSATMTSTEWNAYYPAGMTADQYNADPMKGFTL